MKIALVTTTINIPTILKDYDLAAKYTDNEVKMFITGDTISPDEEIRDLVVSLYTEAKYMSYEEQDARWPELSKIIGPRKIQRRNFAYLMAIQDWDPDVIITIDDDNKPVSVKTFFDNFSNLGGPSNVEVLKGLTNNKVNPFNNNPNRKCNIFKRGYSVSNRMSEHDNQIYSCGGGFLRIGVLEGIALGDPDIDAITRINSAAGDVTREMQEIAKVPCNWAYPEDWFPYNSQCTGFIKELLPYQFLFPYVGRFDDILASYLSGLIMKKMGYDVSFGQPYAMQIRNKHNLIKDLRDETWGMEYIDRIIDEILEPLSHKECKIDKNLDGLYFEALEKIKIISPEFDDKNIEAAKEFFKIIRGE